MSSTHRAGAPRGAKAVYAVAALVVLTSAAWIWSSQRLQHVGADSVGVGTRDDPRDYVRRRPFDVAGWLAWMSESVTDSSARPTPTALQVMQATKRLAPVDPQVLRAAFVLSLQDGDLAKGLLGAAEMAVTFPTEREAAFSTLLANTHRTEWTAFFAGQVQTKWAAIDDFLLFACQRASPLPTLLKLAEAVMRQRALPDSVITCVGQKAINEGSVQTAQWLWLNGSASIPKSIGNVFNGDFELPLSGHLFDWRLGEGGEFRDGFAISVGREDTRGNANSALSIRFNGREIRSPLAQQVLALGPGQYLLSYAYREISMTPAGALSWSLRCVAPGLLTAPTVSAVSTRTTGDGAQLREHTVTIPPGCDGQVLELQAGSREQMRIGMRGSIVIDNVRVLRQVNPPSR